MESLPDFRNKRICIFGLPGSGKSYFCKWLMRQIPNSIIYDPNKEHEGYNRYFPKHIDGSGLGRVELSNFIQHMVIPNPKVEFVLIDEANLYLWPKPSPLPAGMLQLNERSRHINGGVGFACISRRPVSLNSDVTELSHYIIIFNLKGLNDERYLESLAKGLGEAATTLPPHNFILVNQMREWKVYGPVA